MAEEEEPEGDVPKKRSRLPLILGLVLGLVLGGGGFYAVFSGLLLAPADTHASENDPGPALEPLPKVAFVPVDPLTINLGKGSANRHLRFRAELEVEPSAEKEVTTMLPRVVDVLNGYLRAVDLSDLAEPTSLIKLRAQMLRRVQMVTGDGRVRDLLIMEFVLN